MVRLRAIAIIYKQAGFAAPSDGVLAARSERYCQQRYALLRQPSPKRITKTTDQMKPLLSERGRRGGTLRQAKPLLQASGARQRLGAEIQSISAKATCPYTYMEASTDPYFCRYSRSKS